LVCGLSISISFIKENDVVRCVVYRDNNIVVMEVRHVFTTLGSLNIYVVECPLAYLFFE
jgi:hypothetical protein